MPRPRKEQVSISDTPYYHVVSRCVRKTFLCGTDLTTGKSYEHRRSWIENRIRILSSIFDIDICSYAVMSNHLHIVLKLGSEQADEWTTGEVLERWTSLYKGPRLIQRLIESDTLDKAEQDAADICIVEYRKRLKDLSWFMKALNEPIAREANKEDGCTGHFWESRFKSQALLTEESVLSCMAYVDLNPVRANMANTPEESDHTSIKERISPQFCLQTAIKEQIGLQCLAKFQLPLKPLLKFEGNVNNKEQTGILFSAVDYLELVDYTGRIVKEGKRGAINQLTPSILKRLNLNTDEWIARSCAFEENYHRLFSKRRSTKRKVA